MVQASVVHVDGAAGRDDVVGYAHLRVAETGGVLEDPDTALHQLGVEGPGQLIDELLVRDPGGRA